MTKSKKFLNKNLRQLEREFPGEILPPEKLPLIGREHDFSRVPLQDFDNEHLRFMIQQGFGWKFLIPIAIAILSENPFAETDRSDAGLLSAVLGVKESYWRKNPDLYAQAEEVLRKAESIRTKEAEAILTIMLPQKIYDFRKKNSFADD